LVVVDVAGRGSACATLADHVATHLLGLLVMGCRLERATCIAERDFACEMPHESGHTVADFVAVFAALLEPSRRCLHYVSAGHETALLLSRDRSHRHLEVTGPAFGIRNRPRYPIASVRFVPGDDLIVVTDGVTDARNSEGITFGSSGVVRAASRGAGDEERAQSILDQAPSSRDFSPDDRAAVVITYSRY